MSKIRALFLDVGGVLLTNGWDTKTRKRACEHFDLDVKELESRHHLIYDTYEQGKMTLQDYLKRLVFYQDRPFTFDQFFNYMKEQSKPLPGMIDLIKEVKEKYHLKIACVSNEGRDLTLHRVKAYHFHQFVDYFIFSCFVHLKKPDSQIFRLALDVGMFSPEEVIYLDDRQMLADEAKALGIHAIHHKSLEDTKSLLATKL